MDCRAFSMVRQSSVDCALEQARLACARWQAQWGIAAAAHWLAMRAWEQSGGTSVWLGHGSGVTAQFWFEASADFEDELARRMFPFEVGETLRGHSIAAGAGAAAMQALLDTLVQAFSCEPAQQTEAPQSGGAPPDWMHAIASGAVVLEMSLGAVSLSCLLSPDCVRALGQTATPAKEALMPVAIAGALHQCEVELPVALGGAQISLGDLMSLAEGDVIVLDAPVGQALKIREADGGACLFEAYLGERGNRFALDVSGPESLTV